MKFQPPGCALLVLLAVAGAPAPGDDVFQVLPDWQPVLIGEGVEQLQLADLDGDGIPEILVSAWVEHQEYDSYCCILGYRDGGCSVLWQSPWASALGYIESLGTMDVDLDGYPEIVAGRNNGNIEIFDGRSFTLLKTIATGANDIYGPTGADIDADGRAELLFGDDRGILHIYDALTGTEKTQLAGFGSLSLIENVDADPDLEIILSKGTTGRVLNGRTLEVEWTYAGGFGQLRKLGNVDDDPLPELITVSNDRLLTVFDLDQQAVKYSVTITPTPKALTVGDLDDDGGPADVLVASTSRVYVYNGATGSLRWSVENPDHDLWRIEVGDIDGDGGTEIVWTSEGGTGSLGRLYVFNGATRAKRIVI